MYEIETRIEDINLTAKRLAEGLLLDAVEQHFTDDHAIADAARFYHEMTCRHEFSQSWRDKAKGQRGEFDFDGMDWGKDDNDPFYSVEADAAPAKVKNKRG